MSSMVDHLLSQQYSRLGKPDASLLSEPQLSDEDAARLVEAYERNDSSESDYLALVTKTRPFTPPPTTHSVIIDSGTYCSTVAMPIVFKSFIQDHANPVVKETLSRHEVVLVEKISSGVLVHVRSSEAERELVGQEIMLLGRKFKIKRRSPFVNKFYLDIFGIRSTEMANALFMSFTALGARPLFLTPRDVNLEAQVTTPTWRFYFGQEQPPPCLVVSGFVTNQLVYGRKFYLARGRRSLAPPQRASGFKQSPYAVKLPVAPVQHLATAHASKAAKAGEKESFSPHRELKVASTPPAHPKKSSKLQGILNQEETLCEDEATFASPGMPRPTCRQNPEVDESERMQMDTEMASVSCASSASSEDDVDMARQLESGFKRNERSFADKNPFDALETLDCEFEGFEPDVPQEMTPGILIVPKLTATKAAPEPLPTKRRTANLEKPVKPTLVPEETILVSAEETSLESRSDRVVQNMQHLDQVQELMKTSKNMDKVRESMRTFPTAWSTVVCSDLAQDEQKFKEITDIHLLNRILAANMGADKTMSFHQRAVASQLPLGKTRQSYMQFLGTAVAGKPAQVKDQWEILRLLSSFELLLMSTCPFVFESQEWLKYLAGQSDPVIPNTEGQFLSDATILHLLRSRLGHLLMTKLCELVPTSVILASIQALGANDLSPNDLPMVSLEYLSPEMRADTEN